MHRNSQKRIYSDYVYFITCDVQDKFIYFNEEILCEFWIEELRLAKEIKKFALCAFCLNYEHFHLLIKPYNRIANYSQIMHFLKRHASRNINIILGYNDFDLNNIMKKSRPEGDVGNDVSFVEGDVGNDVSFTEGDVGQRRLRREFDKITQHYRDKYIIKHANNSHLPKFKWQKSFHDHIIRNDYDFRNHWNYTMYNFLKHNLPENWKYTGLNYPEIIDDINFL
jgi:REP element-mobilizing transposase RayT